MCTNNSKYRAIFRSYGNNDPSFSVKLDIFKFSKCYKCDLN